MCCCSSFEVSMALAAVVNGPQLNDPVEGSERDTQEGPMVEGAGGIMSPVLVSAAPAAVRLPKWSSQPRSPLTGRRWKAIRVWGRRTFARMIGNSKFLAAPFVSSRSTDTKSGPPMLADT